MSAPTEAHISLEEFVELKSHGSAVMAKHLPAPVLLTTLSADEAHAAHQSAADLTELDLGEWLPWQTTLQETSAFGHSRRSQHLMELLQFTDLQQALPVEEDNYGQEMQCFLDMDDVLIEPRRPVSNNITQFVVPSSRSQATTRQQTAGDELNSKRRGKTARSTSSVKRSRLPLIDMDWDSNDSDSLPDVDFDVARHVEKVVVEAAINDDEAWVVESCVADGRRGNDKKVEILPNILQVSHPDPSVQTRGEESHRDPCDEASHGDETDGGVQHPAGMPYHVPPAPPLADIAQLLGAMTTQGLESVDVNLIAQNTNEDYGYVPLQWPGLLGMPESKDTGNREQNSSHNSKDSAVKHPLTDGGASEDTVLQWIPLGGVFLLDRWTNYDCDVQCVSDTHSPTEVENALRHETADDGVHDAVSADCDTSHIVAVSQHPAQPQSAPNSPKVDSLSPPLGVTGPGPSASQGTHTPRLAHTAQALTSSNDMCPPCKAGKAAKPSTSAELDCDIFEEKKGRAGSVGNTRTCGHLSNPPDNLGTGKPPQQSITDKRYKEVDVDDVRNQCIRQEKHGTGTQPQQTVTARRNDDDVDDVHHQSNCPDHQTQRADKRPQQSVTATRNDDHEHVCHQSKRSVNNGTGTHPQQSVSATRKNYDDDVHQSTFPDNQRAGRQLQQTDTARRNDDDDHHHQCKHPGHQGTGKEPQQSETDRRNSSTVDEKLAYDVSVSDSYLHTNFLDDDDDFECVKVLPRKSPNAPRKESSTCQIREVVQAGTGEVQISSLGPSMPVTSPLSFAATKSPVSEAAYTSKNESLFTFTQALDCVHSHPALESECSDKNSMVESVDDQSHGNKLYQTTPGGQTSSQNKDTEEDRMQDLLSTLPEAQEDDQDIPNFDLGFDFDEDVIPPSPEAESTVSQLTGKVPLTVCVPVHASGMPEALDGDFGPKEDSVHTSVSTKSDSTEQWSPCFISSFQPKEFQTSDETGGLPAVTETTDDFLQLPIIPGNSLKRRLTLNQGHKSRQKQWTCSDAKQAKRSDDCVGVETEAAPLSSQGFQCQTSVTHYGVKTGNATLQKQPAKSPASGEKDSNFVGEKSSSIKPQLRLSSIGSSHPADDVLYEDFAPSFVWDDEFEDKSGFDSKDLSTEWVTPRLDSAKPKPFASSLYCSTPINDKKQKNAGSSFKADRPGTTLSSRKAVFDLGFEDDDGGSDFEDSLITTKKPKVGILQSSEDSDGNNNAAGTKKRTTVFPKQTKKVKRRKRVCGFLDDEAELSDDVAVSSDEADDQMEMMESSFIDNCTEMTQASQVDMQAVYMKSVRSPVPQGAGQRGRYRLQFDHAPLNVFSQLPPQEEEESQYQEDSFCVGSEEEESTYDYSEEDESLGGKTHGVPRKSKQAVTEMKGRRRLKRLAESSSDDNEELNRLPPSQITPLHRKAVSVKALLSSSDENFENSMKQISPAASKSTRCERDSDCDTRCAIGKKAGVVVSPSSQGFQVGSRTTSSVTEITSVSREGREEMSGAQHSVGISSMNKSTDRKLSRVNRDDQIFIPPGRKSNPSKPIGRPFQKPAQTTTHTRVQPPTLTSSMHCLEDGGDSNSEGRSHDGIASVTAAQAVVCGGETVLGDTGQSEGAGVLQTRDDRESSDSGSKFTSIVSRERGKTVIFVDSREISGAQDIVSALRLEHSVHVCTRQLSACDYIISNRMAVERFNMSSFSNGANRSKLAERIQQMQCLYDRCVIIVEKDRVRPGEEKNIKPQHQSKYVHSLLAQLTVTAIQMFFTEDQGETARLLAQLTNIECRKGMAISAPVDLTPHKEQIVKFYLSIPRLTITHALNLCFNFTSIHDFMTSSVKGIQTKGHMSFSRASEAVNYVRHRFSIAMTSGR